MILQHSLDSLQSILSSCLVKPCLYEGSDFGRPLDLVFEFLHLSFRLIWNFYAYNRHVACFLGLPNGLLSDKPSRAALTNERSQRKRDLVRLPAKERCLENSFPFLTSRHLSGPCRPRRCPPDENLVAPSDPYQTLSPFDRGPEPQGLQYVLGERSPATSSQHRLLVTRLRVSLSKRSLRRLPESTESLFSPGMPSLASVTSSQRWGRSSFLLG